MERYTVCPLAGQKEKILFLEYFIFYFRGSSEAAMGGGTHSIPFGALKELSHEIDFKNVDEKGQIFALLRAATGF